ncbi:rhodanese-like domain-containing protein [Nesterenkonia halotolerans]|uniref:rhodanese-like domain-containing protein n=1 Tax=Nesterenkonia halotolerans TaxID=225325 RepID=UPI003EE4A8AF
MTPPLNATDFFSAKLRFETDPADLAADRAGGASPLVLDVRSTEAWRQGHIPGALHIPGAELTARADELGTDRDRAVVVYCWGPGCNGSTRAALSLATLGFTAVRELIGGFEYWAREGFLVESHAGRHRQSPDPLTAPAQT